MALQIIVLGSAAGGGVPQWNCACEVCRLAWKASGRVRRRTQAGLAVSANGSAWHLINASPDLRQQILQNVRLWPNGTGRSTPIASVTIMGTEVDQVGGLLTLREGQEYRLFAPRGVLDVLSANALFQPLDADSVECCPLELEQGASLLEGDGGASELTITAFAVPGKIGSHAVNVGLLIGEASAQPKMAFVPACARVTDALVDRLSGVDLLFFDGSFWSHDEMAKVGQAHRSPLSMGHLPISGPEGSVAMWKDATIGQKVFIHVNNTNPILIDDSAERRFVEASGWSVACDGQEYVL